MRQAAPPVGAIQAAHDLLDDLRAKLGDQPLGCSKVNIFASDLDEIAGFADQMLLMMNTIGPVQ